MVLNFQVRKPITLPIHWKVNYIIDSTGKRVILEMIQTEAAIYDTVGHTYEIALKTPKIDVS